MAQRNDGANDPTEAPVPTPTAVKELLGRARQELEDRKRKLLAEQETQLLRSAFRPAAAAAAPSSIFDVDDGGGMQHATFTSTRTTVTAATTRTYNNPPLPTATATAAMDVQARLAQLKATVAQKIASSGIQAKLAASNAGIPVPYAALPENITVRTGPQPNFVVDALGRMVDASTGQVVDMQRKPHASVKVNLRPTTDTTSRQARNKQDTDRATTSSSGGKVNNKSTTDAADDDVTKAKKSTVYDENLIVRPAMRAKRQFRFFEKGTFIKQGEQKRKQVQVDRLNADIASRAERAGIQSTAALLRLQPSTATAGGNSDESGSGGLVPDAEWWDGELWECFVKAGLQRDTLYTSEECARLTFSHGNTVFGDLITAEIEHPVQAAPPTSIDKEINLPIMMTKKERKKLRRQTRRERLKEKQDRIRLGLDPPAEPKVKLSNFMRVLGNDAIQDPTKAEAFVRKQVAERARKHVRANEQRKLKPEQRRDKRRRKMEEDTSEEVQVAVYAVRDLSSKQRQWKVQKNINDLLMSGVVVYFKPLSIVVAEGGPKQQKKLARLMLHRINWNEKKFKASSKAAAADVDDIADRDDADDDADDDHDDDDDDNARGGDGGKTAIELEHAAGCKLVWSGTVTKRQFPRPVRVKPFDQEPKVRELFQYHKCEQYWDAASSQKFMLEQEVQKLRA